MLKDPTLALDLLTFASAQPVCSGAPPLLITTTDAACAPEGDDGMALPARLETIPRAMSMMASVAAAFLVVVEKPLQVADPF